MILITKMMNQIRRNNQLFKNTKIPYLKLIPILVIAFILYELISNIEFLLTGVKFFVSIMSYVIWAFAIAYLLNPLMVLIEKIIKLKRYLSIIIVYILYLGIIAFFITVISPVIVKNIGDLIENLPKYILVTREAIDTFLTKTEWVKDYGLDVLVIDNLSYITNEIKDFMELTLNGIIKNAIILTSTMFQFIFGSLISVYLLKDKEVLIRSIKKFIYAFISTSKSDKLMIVGKKVNYMFSRFLIGKTLDSLIIAILCFIGLTILKIPYALLISLIIGVTNMIPYFGPFIGAVPAVILTFFYSPIKSLWVLVFILILQQFDGWILGPKILGDSVGLSPFWIIMGILIGGGLLGPIGMILGVPLMASVKVFLSEYIDKKLKSKEVSIE